MNTAEQTSRCTAGDAFRFTPQAGSWWLVLGCAVYLSCVSVLARPIVLFKDNFTPRTLGLPEQSFLSDFARLEGLANDHIHGRNDLLIARARQTGRFAPTPYVVTKDKVRVEDGRMLVIEAGGYATLARNFNGLHSMHGLRISFDFATINASFKDWTEISFGAAQDDHTANYNKSVPHFSFRFQANGDLLLSADGSSLTVFGWKTFGSPSNDRYHVEILCTDPSDGNPFDGKGETKIELLVNGQPTPFPGHTKNEGGYSNNYVTLRSSPNSVSHFDNLTIEKHATSPDSQGTTPLPPGALAWWQADGTLDDALGYYDGKQRIQLDINDYSNAPLIVQALLLYLGDEKDTPLANKDSMVVPILGTSKEETKLKQLNALKYLILGGKEWDGKFPPVGYDNGRLEKGFSSPVVFEPQGNDFSFAADEDFTVEGWVRLSDFEEDNAGIFQNSWQRLIEFLPPIALAINETVKVIPKEFIDIDFEIFPIPVLPLEVGYKLMVKEGRLAAEINGGIELSDLLNPDPTKIVGLAKQVFEGSAHVALLGKPNVLKVGQWHHVALVLSRSEKTATLYVDGKVDAASTDSDKTALTKTLQPLSFTLSDFTDLLPTEIPSTTILKPLFKKTDVRLMTVDNVASLPTTEEFKAFLAQVGPEKTLHVRVFAQEGNIILDVGEAQLPGDSREIEVLKTYLDPLWQEPSLTDVQKSRIIDLSISSIILHTSIMLPSQTSIGAAKPTLTRGPLSAIPVDNIVKFDISGIASKIPGVGGLIQKAIDFAWDQIEILLPRLIAELERTGVLPNSIPKKSPPVGFKGGIDELTVYKRALSASEIQSISNSGPAGKGQSDPVAIGTSPTIVLGPNEGAAAVSIDNGSYDLDRGDWITVTQTPPGPYSPEELNEITPIPGTTEVQLTVTDSSGKSVSASFPDHIRIHDKTPPITRVKDITVYLDATGNVTITPEQVDDGSTDNWEIRTMTLDRTSFDCADVGEWHNVTLTVTDPHNNSSSAVARVFVDDKLPPIVEVARQVALGPDGRVEIEPGHLMLSASDNCAVDWNGRRVTSYPRVFKCYDIGEQTVGLEVPDVNGNSWRKTFTITVVDTVAPVISLVGSQNMEMFVGDAYIERGAIVEDACDPDVQTRLEIGGDDVDTSKPGIYDVIYNATDRYGNRAAMVVRKVVVLPFEGDQGLPLLARETLAWWQAEGDARDFLGTNHGTLENGISFTDGPFRAGELGRAFSLDGVDDYVRVPALNASAYNTEMTVEFWAKIDTIQPGAGMGQGSENVDEPGSNVWVIHLDGTDGLKFAVNDNGAWRIAGMEGLYSGVWSHIACVADSGSTRIYFNTILVGTGPGISTRIQHNPDSVVHIGKDVRFANGPSFHGALDEVTLYNRALKEYEIRAIFGARGKGKLPPAPLLHNTVEWWTAEINVENQSPDVLRVFDYLSSRLAYLDDHAAIVNGKVFKAFHVDGTDDHVDIPEPFRTFGNEITVEFWANIVKAQQGSGLGLGVPSAVDTDDVWLMHFSEPGPGGDFDLEFMVNDSGTWRSASFSAVPPAFWVHIAGVADGASTRIYMNGGLIGSGPGISSGIHFNPGSMMRIGQDVRYVTGGFIGGQFDEITIYDRALTTSEIQSIFGASGNGKANARPVFVSGGALAALANSANDLKDLLHVSDPDSPQTLSWRPAYEPSHGTLSFWGGNTAPAGGTDIEPGGAIEYVPDPGYLGPDSFIVQVSDGANSTLLRIPVTVSNSELIYVGDRTEVILNVSASATDIRHLLRVSDTDPGQQINWSLGDPPANGIVDIPFAQSPTGSRDITPGGSITYTPNPGACCTDSFSILATDGLESISRTITVKMINFQPGFKGGPVSLRRQVNEPPLDVASFLHAFDGDTGQTLTWFEATAPIYGTLTFSGATAPSGSSDIAPGGSIIYTPLPNDYRQDVFTVGMTDGFDSNFLTFTIEFVNSAPRFVGSSGSIQLPVSAPAYDVRPLLHASDSNSGQTLTWLQHSGPNHGTLNIIGATAPSGGSDIAPGGVITYTPNPGYAGPDSFTVRVIDGPGSAERTIPVLVTNVKPEFLAVPSTTFSVTANSGPREINEFLHVSDTDSDQTLTWTPAPAPSHGTLSLEATGVTASSGGTDIVPGVPITYTPEPGFVGRDSFNIAVTDGSDTAYRVLSVDVVNRAPRFIDLGSIVTVERNASATDIKNLLGVFDQDLGQTLTWSQHTPPSNGTLDISHPTADASNVGVEPSGTLTYTPNPGFYGDDSFVIEVSDGFETATRTCVVSVSYPLFTVNQAKLEFGGNDSYGASVALSGDSALVAPVSGGVAAYERVNGSWVSSGGLVSLDLAHGDRFGFSIALSGDTALVGARDADVNGILYDGAAYVFVRSGNTWSQQAKLTIDEPTEGGRGFGSAVALEGDTAFVGAYGELVDGHTVAGAVYVFERNGDVWTQTAKLTAGDPQHGASFGSDIALERDTVVVGAPGAAYVFQRDGSDWTHQAKLVPSDPAVSSGFGALGSIGLSGNTAIIGGMTASGNRTVYVFDRIGTTWSEHGTIGTADTESNPLSYGSSVAVSGNWAVIGDSAASPSGAPFLGAVYVFERIGTVWTKRHRLTPSDGAPLDLFGTSVAISENTLFVGAPNTTILSAPNAGAAYVFTVADTVLTFTGGAEPLNVHVNDSAIDVRDRLRVRNSDVGQTITWSEHDAPGNGTLAINSATAASGGTEIVSGGTITYQPNANYIGKDRFTIEVDDGTDKALRTILVNVENTVPTFVGSNDRLEVELNAAATDITERLHVSDTDNSQLLTWTVAALPRHGTVLLSDATASSAGVDIAPGGIITYAPDTDYFGPDAFTVQVSDGIDTTSRTIFVHVNADQLFTVAQGNLTARDTAANDNLGWSVAVSGGTALVGARGVSAETGAAYVYVRDGSGWTEQAKLAVDGVAPGQRFGNAVALSGDTALVGAMGANAAYLFEREGETWTLNASLTVPSSFGFGASVAIIGDAAVVGASGTTVDSKVGAGSVYLFIRIDGVWTLGLVLQASDPDEFAHFGSGVALDLNPFTIAVGSSADIQGVHAAGAVYVFAFNEDGLYEQAKLFATDPINSSHFGASGTIGLDDDTLLIGGTFTQAVYVFQRTGDAWNRQAKLVADDPQSLNFGRSVALSGGAALIGANRASPDDLDGAGAAYLFKSDGNTWTKIKRLTGGDRLANDFYGFSVALDGLTAVVGAPLATRGGNFGSGQAYAYDSVFDEPPNIVPAFVGSPGTLGVGRNGLPTEINDWLIVSDLDDGQTLTWTEGTPPSYGSLNFSSATAPSGRTEIRMGGTVTYTPDPGFVGTDSFTVQVSDGVGIGTRTVHVSVTIGGGEAFTIPTDSLATVRFRHTATLLNDGNILIAGGLNGSSRLASAELFDAVTRTFSDVGSMSIDREYHTATLLLDGRVLIVGGRVQTGAIVGTAELYDPVTDMFTQVEGMRNQRFLHTATLLPSGEVLITGGIVPQPGGISVSSPATEVYNPATGTFSGSGVMLSGRSNHTATLLPNGKVLVLGGRGNGYQKDAELYDPVTRTFTATGSMAVARENHTATLLPDGNVLVAGGEGVGAILLSSAELYDTSSGTFASAGQLSAPRYDAPAVLLGNGKVLIAGGINLASTDVYDPASGTFSPGASMTVPRQDATASLFADGMVLLAGGFGRASAELYLGEETGNYLPLFVGYDATLEVDANAAPVDIGDQLHGNDLNTGQTLTWSESSAPSHGVLNFSGATASSGSSDIAPPLGAITYTPSPGYVGPDRFVIQVSDGTATAVRTIVATITVKPLFTIQEAKLEFGGNDRYGSSVALSGDSALVAPLSGGVLAYERVNGSWVNSGGLASLDLAHGDRFGFSIALSGDTALVGARDADVNGILYDGAAYVFVRSGNTWSQQAKLTIDEPTEGGRGFGSAVALEGDTAFVGAYGELVDGHTVAGAVYVFERNGDVWTQTAKLTAGDPQHGASFGSDISLERDTVVVGAPGAAYVFQRDGSDWTHQAKLVPSDPSASSGFGALGSIGLSGNTAIIGGVTASGNRTVYVFDRIGTTWSEQARLAANDPESNPASYGSAVALSGEWAAIGDSGAGPGGTPGAGAVYVFERAGTVWTKRDRLTPSDRAQSDLFGTSVAISENTLFVGAPNSSRFVGSSEGAAYAFTVPDTVLAFTGPIEPLVLTANASAADVKDRLHVSNSDAGQIITWSQYSEPAHGDLSLIDATAASGGTDIAPGGTITYTPHTGYAGPDQFTIQAADGTDSARRTIVVTVENVAPSFVGPAEFFVDQNSPPTDVKLYLHASDTDDGQTLTWAQSSAPSHGTLVVSGATAPSGGTDITPGGTITYRPALGYVGSDSFAVQVSDGVVATERTILFAVGNVAPTFVSASSSFSVVPDGPAKDIKSLLHVSDTDIRQTLTWSQGSPPTKGSLSISGATALSGGTGITPGGSITYTPTPGETGADSFTVQVTDGRNTTTRTISVHFLGEQGKLIAGEPDFGASLGWSVAVSGDTVLVGARESNNPPPKRLFTCWMGADGRSKQSLRAAM